MSSNTTAEKPKIYTISEAAQLIDGLSESCIRRMCQRGEIACFKAGRKYLISKQALFNAVFGEYKNRA